MRPSVWPAQVRSELSSLIPYVLLRAASRRGHPFWLGRCARNQDPSFLKTSPACASAGPRAMLASRAPLTLRVPRRATTAPTAREALPLPGDRRPSTGFAHRRPPSAGERLPDSTEHRPPRTDSDSDSLRSDAPRADHPASAHGLHRMPTTRPPPRAVVALRWTVVASDGPLLRGHSLESGAARRVRSRLCRLYGAFPRIDPREAPVRGYAPQPNAQRSTHVAWGVSRETHERQSSVGARTPGRPAAEPDKHPTPRRRRAVRPASLDDLDGAQLRRRSRAAQDSRSGATTRCRSGSVPSEYVSTSPRSFRCSWTTFRSVALMASSATGRPFLTASLAA